MCQLSSGGAGEGTLSIVRVPSTTLARPKSATLRTGRSSCARSTFYGIESVSEQSGEKTQPRQCTSGLRSRCLENGCTASMRCQSWKEETIECRGRDGTYRKSGTWTINIVSCHVIQRMRDQRSYDSPTPVLSRRVDPRLQSPLRLYYQLRGNGPAE